MCSCFMKMDKAVMAVLNKLVMASFLIVMSVGCVTTTDKGHSVITSEYEKFKASLPPAQWVPVGFKSIDDVGILSAQLYRETYIYMQEYMQATENHRYYVGLLNEVDEIKKREGIDDNLALQKALNNINEANKQDGGETMRRVVEGYNAVQALKPANKIQRLVPVFRKLVDVIVQAKQLPRDIEAASCDLVQTIRLGASVTNILQQLYYSQKMAQYINLQYRRNIKMAKYMQDMTD